MGDALLLVFGSFCCDVIQDAISSKHFLGVSWRIGVFVVDFVGKGVRQFDGPLEYMLCLSALNTFPSFFCCLVHSYA